MHDVCVGFCRADFPSLKLRILSFPLSHPLFFGLFAIVYIVAMTMDEFMAKRAETRSNAAMFGEKKGTRAVEMDLSGLSKRENEVLGIYGNFGAVKDAKATHKEQRSTGKTQILDVSFRNASLENQGQDREDRPPREGRGGGRGEGRGGRGEGRGGRGQKPSHSTSSAPRAAGGQLDISDSGAFPSL